MTYCYDRMILIKDPDTETDYLTGALDMTEALLEKLDEMLNQYNLPHAFTLPFFDGSDPDPDNAVVRMFYREEDEMTVELVYCLFSHLHRHVPGAKIYQGFAKKAKRLTENE